MVVTRSDYPDDVEYDWKAEAEKLRKMELEIRKAEQEAEQWFSYTAPHEENIRNSCAHYSQRNV